MRYVWIREITNEVRSNTKRDTEFDLFDGVSTRLDVKYIKPNEGRTNWQWECAENVLLL
jgi:hypothetical protein